MTFIPIGPESNLAAHFFGRILLQPSSTSTSSRRCLGSNSDAAQLAVIRAGGGIGMCQAGLAAGDPDLVQLFPEEFNPQLMAFLVMHENLKMVPRCRAAFDALADGLLASRGTVQGLNF